MKTGTVCIVFYCTVPVLVICSFIASCGFTDADYLCLKVRQYFIVDSLSRWVTCRSMSLTNQGGEGETKNTFPALRKKVACCHMYVCVYGEKWPIAYSSLESRCHCRCRHFSTCWSSPSEPWSAGGWRCLGGWCPQPPQGYSPGWSVHLFELQGSTFEVKNTTNQINSMYYFWQGAR